MLSRRELFRYLGLSAGVGLARLGSSFSGRIGDLGIILGLVNEPLNRDYLATLREIAETGYRHVEFGSHYGPNPEAFKNALDKWGLVPLAGGSSMADMKENIDSLIDSSLAFGKRYLVCYWPWMHSGDQIAGYSELQRVAEELNRLGEICRRSGLKFALHNHDVEFRRVDGRVPYRVFLEETDPKLVTMEVDIYWLIKGGGDPIAYFKQYPGRFELCHLKDMDSTPERGITTAGKGIIDYPKILSYSKTAGLRYFIVEQDGSKKPIQDMRSAHEFLSQLTF